MKYKKGDLVKIVSCDVNPYFVGKKGIVVQALQAYIPLYKIMVSGNIITDYATEDCLVPIGTSTIWHSMSEQPVKGEHIVIACPHSFYGIVLRTGGSQLKNENKAKYTKWCYVEDILNLANMEEEQQ